MLVDIGAYMVDRARKRAGEAVDEIIAAIGDKEKVIVLLKRYLEKIKKPFNEKLLADWEAYIRGQREGIENDKLFREQIVHLLAGAELVQNEVFKCVEPLMGATIAGHLQARIPVEAIKVE